MIIRFFATTKKTTKWPRQAQPPYLFGEKEGRKSAAKTHLFSPPLVLKSMDTELVEVQKEYNLLSC